MQTAGYNIKINMEMNYMVEPGDFVFMVGGSSDDVQQITYNLKE